MQICPVNNLCNMFFHKHISDFEIFPPLVESIETGDWLPVKIPHPPLFLYLANVTGGA